MQAVSNAIMCRPSRINSWLLHESLICEHRLLSRRIKRRLVLNFPTIKPNLLIRLKQIFFHNLNIFLQSHQKTIKKSSKHKVEKKKERKPRAKLKLVHKQSHTAADYLSYLNIFLSRTTFFYANKTCKIHGRKNCPAKASAHSFELHTDKEIYSLHSRATVKSTRQENVWSIKWNLMPPKVLPETKIPATFLSP